MTKIMIVIGLLAFTACDPHSSIEMMPSPEAQAVALNETWAELTDAEREDNCFTYELLGDEEMIKLFESGAGFDVDDEVFLSFLDDQC